MLGEPANRSDLKIGVAENVVGGQPEGAEIIVGQVAVGKFADPQAASQPFARDRDQEGLERGEEEHRARLCP